MTCLRLIPLFLLLLARLASAAVSCTTAQVDFGDFVSEVSFLHTGTAGSDRVAFIDVGVYSFDEAVTVNLPTYGADTSTLITTATAQLGRLAASYRLIAPATTSELVTITTDVSSSIVLGVITCSGVDQTTPIGTPGTHAIANTGPQESPFCVTVTSAADDVLKDVVNLFSSPTLTVVSPQTEHWRQQSANGGLDIHVGTSTKPGAAGSQTMCWTNNSDSSQASVAVSIKPAAAAAVRRAVAPMRFE